MIPVHGFDTKLEEGKAKRCPFCGSRNIWIGSREKFNKIVEEHGSACLNVGCADCHAEAVSYSTECGNENDYDERMRIALNKWNMRNDEGV